MTESLRIGRYEALRPIASGGMATVYLGRVLGARGFERQVAIKVMHPHIADDPEFVSMFLDEARMASTIRHPNVVPTLDVVEEEGRLFLVMEYIEGRPLQELVRAFQRRKERLPLGVALRVALDLLAGLYAAHEHASPDGAPMKIVHRDVSPQNVLVGADGLSRIMDFGIARAETRITTTKGTSPKGKIPYMSPEQLQTAPLDHRTDIYAAGIVAWEMLTGERLFEADNHGRLLAMVLDGAKRSPIEVNAAVPPPISAACMRALAREADDRWPTAAAFAEALEAAAVEAGTPIAPARAVAALVKELPPERVRPMDLTPTPNRSSQASSAGLTPLGSDPGANLKSGVSSSGGGQTIDERSPPGEILAIPGLPSRGGALRVAAAIAAASLVTGVVVWLLTRSPDPHVNALAVPSLTASAGPSAAPPATTVAALPEPVPPPAASAAKAAAPPKAIDPTRAVAAPGKPPPARPKPTAFHPEDP